jgi:hypothetical protein
MSSACMGLFSERPARMEFQTANIPFHFTNPASTCISQSDLFSPRTPLESRLRNRPTSVRAFVDFLSSSRRLLGTLEIDNYQFFSNPRQHFKRHNEPLQLTEYHRRGFHSSQYIKMRKPISSLILSYSYITAKKKKKRLKVKRQLQCPMLCYDLASYVSQYLQIFSDSLFGSDYNSIQAEFKAGSHYRTGHYKDTVRSFWTKYKNCNFILNCIHFEFS